MDKLIWHTEQRKINELIPFEGNPRKMTKEQAEQLRKSLEKFNLAEIPAIDTDNKIIAGHQRVNILQELGKGNEIIDVRIPNRKLTEDEFREYNLRSNKNIGSWDYDELANFDEELLTDVGFNEEELNIVMGSVEPEEDDFDVDGAVEEIKEPICKRGDIWQLGDHRLGCLDATVEEDVKKLMDGKKADCVFTDPPYGIDYKSNWREQKTKTKFNKIKGDSNVTDIYPMLRSICKNNSVIYLWTSHQVYPQWRGFAKDIYKSTIIWYKKTGGMGDLKAEYGHNYEMCIYSMIGRCEFVGDRPKAVWEIGTENFNELIHPTQKPVSLAVNAIKHHALSNVVDLFGGSGSTLIACEQLNRKCYMAEIDPIYIQVILERYIKYKGTSDDVFLLKEGKKIPYKEIF